MTPLERRAASGSNLVRPAVRVRHWRRGDVEQIADLYYQTVHRINSRDYGPRQIEAWAPRVEPRSWWLRRFKRRTVFVAEAAGRVVGFAELYPAGKEVDCFYVHHGWQTRGVGRALLERLQRAALRRRWGELAADVSVTARGFFERMGFRVLRVQKKWHRGRVLLQYRMVKRLHARMP